MADNFKYPLPKFCFEVNWGGTRMGFTEVTGLEFETQVIEYREGNSPVLSPNAQPGLRKLSHVTMKRGMVLEDFEFFKLWRETSKFQESNKIKKIFRRDVTISLLNENREPVASWTMINAWPTKMSSTDLKADGNEVAIESLEMVHEGLSIVEAK